MLGTGAAVAVLAVTGCGGSSQLSRADFVTQANKVCKQANAAVQKSKGDIYAKVIAYEHQTSSGIGGLKVPSELKSTVDQYVRGQAAFIGYVKQYQAATKAKQPTKSLQAAGTKLQTQQGKLTRELGLKECRL